MYQWDVLEGFYRVHVEAPGYEPANSIVVSIPPPVTDLAIGLHHINDFLPPSSITNLQSNNGTTWINWTWINPRDSDFSHTGIYLNGSFQNNTSAEYFNATHLRPETSYTIGTRTVDIDGNRNKTWVNSTATTSKESVPVIPVFPGCTKPPTDLDGDSLYEDINGNERLDFADVVTYFNSMQWIRDSSLIAYFDYNRNGRIDFSDVVMLFNMKR